MEAQTDIAMDGVGLELFLKQLPHPLHTPRRPYFCTSSPPFHLPPSAPSSSSSTTSSTPTPTIIFFSSTNLSPSPPVPETFPRYPFPVPFPSPHPFSNTAARPTLHSPFPPPPSDCPLTNPLSMRQRSSRSVLVLDRLLLTLSVICRLSVYLPHRLASSFVWGVISSTGVV